jgi:PAS domain S-box-containing protein
VSGSSLLERAVAASGSGIVIADATRPDHPLTFVNAAFEELTGYSAAECLGRNCRFLQGPDTDPAAIAEIAVALREHREARVVLLNNRKDGTPFFNELRLSPVRDAHGRVVQVVGVQSDVSADVVARRSLELERDRAVAELSVFRRALTPPSLKERPGLALATTFLPAEQGVSGDFHLVAEGLGRATLLVVGDAMGHGLQAARRATYVRTAIATFARSTDDPVRLLEMTNQALIEKGGTTADFVTAVCVSFDPDRGRVRWLSAGHPVPLALDTGEPLGDAAGVGAALGVSVEVGGQVRTASMEAGQGVLLSSDGLAEARSAKRSREEPSSLLGDARVREFVLELRGATPRAIVDQLTAAALAHSGGQLADDLCLLAARASLP